VGHESWVFALHPGAGGHRVHSGAGTSFAWPHPFSAVCLSALLPIICGSPVCSLLLVRVVLLPLSSLTGLGSSATVVELRLHAHLWRPFPCVHVHGGAWCVVQAPEVVSALSEAWVNPDVALLLLLYPILLFIGVFFMLALVQDHGSVTAAAAAVVRKLASFVVSYVYVHKLVHPRGCTRARPLHPPTMHPSWEFQLLQQCCCAFPALVGALCLVLHLHLCPSLCANRM
jgi:hypothetical protein